MRFALIGLLSILFSVTSRVCCKDPDFETQPASLPAVYQPKCGQRHISGVDVNIQKFKDGEAHFGEWPHMCAIFDSGKQRLGGASLISKGVVLTAAHIVVKYNATANRLFVRCGDWDVNNDHEPRAHQDRNVRAIEVHYLHIPPSNRNNIALLFTEQDFDLGEHIDTICLPQPGDVFDNQVCFATGWGKDQFGEEGVYQQRLKEVSLPIVEDAECERAHNTFKAKKGYRQNFQLDHSLLCAGGAGEDTCTGDGGGPLVCAHPGEAGRYVQAGIVNAGVECNTESIPAVYTDVPNLVCWIDWAVTCKGQANPSLPLASFFGFGSRCQQWMDEEKKKLKDLWLRLRKRYQPVKDKYNRLEACKVDWTGKELGMLDNKCISISINHSFTSIAIERDPLCFEPAQSGEHMCRAFFPRFTWSQVSKKLQPCYLRPDI